MIQLFLILKFTIVSHLYFYKLNLKLTFFELQIIKYVFMLDSQSIHIFLSFFLILYIY